MAVLKRGLVVAGLAGAGLLALLGIASASEEETPQGGGPPPPDNDDECAAALAEQQQAIQMVNQLNGAIVDIDAALIEAYMNDPSSAPALEAQKAAIIANRNQWQARANTLNVYRQENC